MRVLFLTWDGPHQSYLESLFFPIFSGLRQRGIEVRTLQLTWASAGQLEPVRLAAERFRTSYTSVALPAPLRRVALPVAVSVGAATALFNLRKEKVDVLFPRSLIPMAMALAVTAVSPSVDLVFEADGLMADERVDFGGWSRRGPSYRVLRRVEAEGVRRARSVICRTQAAREVLIDRAAGDAKELTEKIFVAPNGKDSASFAPGTAADREATRARHGIGRDLPWVVYVGSIGPQYLPARMVTAMERIRQRLPMTRFSFFTSHGSTLRPLLATAPKLAAVTHVHTAEPSAVPSILAAADLGFALRLDTFSQRAVCPIKVAEYLLCGLPVVTSPVGDLPFQLHHEPAALLTSGESASDIEAIADWFLTSVLPRREELRVSARQQGLKWFDLTNSVEKYERVLRHGVAVV